MARDSRSPDDLRAGLSARAEGTGGDAALVLLVDDSADNRATYGEGLRHSGSQVIEAENGRQAVDEAIRSQPDLILLDLEMPVLDGHDATRELKNDPRTRDIPIVILTSHQDTKEIRATIDAADAYLVKPCALRDLEAVVDAFRRVRDEPR